MDEDVVKSKIDEHLNKIQQETIDALNSFRKSGVEVDNDFINRFLKASINRLTQTCICYDVDFRYTNSPQSITANADYVDLTNSPDIETTNPKRKCEEFFNTDEIKKAKIVNANSSTSEYTVSQSFMKCTIFCCIQCMHPDDTNKSFYGTIDDVYRHWMNMHRRSNTSEFLYYAFALCNCYYCDEVATYYDLVKHYKQRHENEEFAIVDRLNFKKCGICHFKDGDLIVHFRESHSEISKFFNPVHYTKKRIDELLTINVYKESRCMFCIDKFATQSDLTEHYTNSHFDDETEGVPDFRSLLSYLVCGYCKGVVKRKQYIGHFKGHVYDFVCQKCNYQSMDLVELILHEKNVHRGMDRLTYHCSEFSRWLKEQNLNTSMVFENGLNLHLYNVLGTEYDNSKAFDAFIDEYMDLVKKRVLRTETYGISTTSTPQTTSDLIDESIIAELEEQRKLINNIYISGIHRQSEDVDLHEIFLNLCRRLEITAYQEDVKEIYQGKTTGLIVKLHCGELKEAILHRMKTKSILSDELVDLKPNENSMKIHVRHQTTKFYCDICVAATKYQRQRDIYSYDICNDGVFIKRTAEDTGVIIQSKQQLCDFVESN